MSSKASSTSSSSSSTSHSSIRPNIITPLKCSYPPAFFFPRYSKYLKCNCDTCHYLRTLALRFAQPVNTEEEVEDELTCKVCGVKMCGSVICRESEDQV